MSKNTRLEPAVLVPPRPTELITRKELAQRLRVSERKILSDREMPVVTFGRNVRYNWDAVLDYLGA